MIDERYLNSTTGESKSYTVTNNGNAYLTSRNLYYEQLQEQSDRDYVEVVRCKDCRFCHAGYCEMADDIIPFGLIYHEWENFYCAWGERREDD